MATIFFDVQYTKLKPWPWTLRWRKQIRNHRSNLHTKFRKRCLNTNVLCTHCIHKNEHNSLSQPSFWTFNTPNESPDRELHDDTSRFSSPLNFPCKFLTQHLTSVASEVWWNPHKPAQPQTVPASTRYQVGWNHYQDQLRQLPELPSTSRSPKHAAPWWL